MRSRPLTAEEEAVWAQTALGAQELRPYYARALLALQPVAVDGLRTVGVGSSWHVYVDFAWLGALTLSERAAVVAAHEIEHLLRDHAGRCCGRQPGAWNVACDAEINDDAHDVRLPAGGVTPALLGQPDGLLAEQYYPEVDEEQEHAHTCGGGSGAGAPQAWEVEEGSGGGVSPEEAELIRDEVAAAVLAAAERGDVPLGIRVWAEARRKPVAIDWRQQFAALVGSLRSSARGRDDVSYRRLHRRQRAGQPVRPGWVRAPLRVGVVIDTSGSMCELGDLVVSVAAMLAEHDCRFVQCDAEIQRVTRRLPSEWQGGGGTDLRPAIERVADSDVVVVISDGITPWPHQLAAPLIAVLPPEAPPPPRWVRAIRVLQ